MPLKNDRTVDRPRADPQASLGAGGAGKGKEAEATCSLVPEQCRICWIRHINTSGLGSGLPSSCSNCNSTGRIIIASSFPLPLSLSLSLFLFPLPCHPSPPGAPIVPLDVLSRYSRSCVLLCAWRRVRSQSASRNELVALDPCLASTAAANT